MGKLNKAAALEWFKAHKDKEIEIKWQGKLVRLRGRGTGVQSLDACSADYEESKLLGLHDDIQIDLSFHDDTLGVHLSVYQAEEKQPAAFVPLSIPYKQLQLTTPEAKKSGEDSSGEASSGEDEGEPEFSPYELLH